MSSRQRKVERHRQRRQRNKKEVRTLSLRHKQQLSSDAHPLYACVVNHDWREKGEASIFLARSVSPTSVTMAAYLVDAWAMGLKDAWGRVDLAVSEFDELTDRVHEELGICPLNIGMARHLVYGGVKLARELGFRLPRKYERWTGILGSLPEGEEPDMGLFCPGGKIRLICSMRDLEARLTGTTPEKFIARPDVEYILGDDDFTLMDEEDDVTGEMFEKLEETFLTRARQWCFANGQAPHPLLPRVISAMTESILEGAPPDLDPDEEVSALSDAELDEVSARMHSFLAASFADQPGELGVAMAQFHAFMQSMDSPEALFEALEIEENLITNDEVEG